MAYTEDVSINLNVLAGTMGGVTAIMGGMSALTSSFGAMATEAMSAFGSVDGLLTGTTALMATFAKQAADAYGEYEQGMKIVQTVSGQAQYSIAQLGEQANQLSVNYRTAIGDITEGLQTLGRAGLNSAESQLEVLESGLQTAKLEGRNLNGVLEELIQNTAMLGGNLNSVDFGAQTEYLNSLMVGTSMTAPITSHDISQTLQYAGGTAAAAGANLENKDKLEDLMGTVAAFAQKGVTGSMAGTALRAFFTKPASQDTSVVNALDELGLSPDALWEDGGESMKKVSDQISIIKRRMDALHMSTIDQVELWGKIVGPKMGQQMMKLDSSSIKELTSNIQNASSAEDLATQTLQTYTQKVSELEEKGSLAFRNFGEKAVMFLNPIVDVLNAITGVLENPAVATGAFIAFLGLLNHGVQAFWRMITSLYKQLKGLFSDTQIAMSNLANGVEGFGGGLSQSASQASLLNAKLKETDATMQAIQAKALNITKTSWVINGGQPGEKVDRGVISSMPQNVFMGGTTVSGLQVGESGKYYTAADKAKVIEDAINVSEKNKQAQLDYAAAQEKVAQSTQAAREKVAIINKDLLALSNRKVNLIADANEITGRNVTSLGGAARTLSSARKNLEADFNINEKVQQRNDLLAEHNITQEDIIATKALAKKKEELVAFLAKEEASFLANERKRLEKYVRDNHNKYSKDDKEHYIRDRGNYIDRSLHDRGKEDSSVNKFDRLYAKEQQELNDITNKLNTAKNQVILNTPMDIGEDATKIENEIVKIKKLEEDIKLASNQNIDKLMMDLEESRVELLAQIRASEMAPMMTQADLEAMFPTATKSEIKNLLNSLSTEMHTQIRVMEENIYQKEMQRLYAAGLRGDAEAALSYSQNKELEAAGVSKIDGTNSRQFVSNTKAPETPSAIVGQAQQTLTNGIAKEMALAQEEFQQKIRQSLYGSQKSYSDLNLRERIQNKSTQVLNSYNNALTSARQRLSDFSTTLTWSRKGFEALSASEKMNQYQSVREAIMPLEKGALSTEEALLRLMKSTGLSAEQLQVLFQKSESLALAFDNLKTKTNTGSTASREDTTMVLSKISQEGNKTTGSFGRLRSAAKTLTGYMGGPFMTAMMAFTVASSAYQALVNNWQKEMSDANNRMSEAKDKISQSEESIKELFTDENSSISEADLNKIVDYQYGAIQESYNADMDKHSKKTKPKFADMYNNEVIKVQNLSWSDDEKKNYEVKTAEDLEALNESTETLSLTEEEHIKQLEENTIALNAATYAFAQALNKEASVFNDPKFGYQGAQTFIENSMGIEGVMADILAIANWPALIMSKLGVKGGDILSGSEGFFDYESGVKTLYQKSDNYAGSTEMSPLLSSDIYQLGVEGGLQQYFGNDFNSIVQNIDQINHKSGTALNYFSTLSNNAFQGMDSKDMAMAQMLWKEDPETMQTLAKQMFRYEQERGINSGHSAMEDWSKGTLYQRNPKEKHPSSKDYMQKIDKKKFTVTDKNLKNTLDKIYKMTDGKLSYSNMLAMGQMQMLQDMYSVANEQLYPALSQTMIAAQQNVLATGTAGTNAGSAASGAGATANNSAIIAGLLGEKLKQEVAGLEYENDYLADENAPTKKLFGFLDTGETLTKEEFIKHYNDLNDPEFNKYRLHGGKTEAGWTKMMMDPSASQDEINAYAERSASKIFNADGSLKADVYRNWGVVQNTIMSPGINAMKKMIASVYDQSQIGEYGGNSGSGSGSGGSGDGSGSGSDSGSGSTKSRVDLVLCSKKQIPKLDVNLFKKAPNFTIKNKQFNVRDIKITSQDKPDAITDAIKNGIISAQKRMDPKIIQSDEAVYDPVAATDGTTPSGTMPVETK